MPSSYYKNIDYYTHYLFGYNLLTTNGSIWRILLQVKEVKTFLATS